MLALILVILTGLTKSEKTIIFLSDDNSIHRFTMAPASHGLGAFSNNLMTALQSTAKRILVCVAESSSCQSFMADILVYTA